MQLASSGARVILLARNEEKLKQISANLPGENHAWYVADFADNKSVEAAASKIAGENHIDILINNTGGPPAGPAHMAGAEEYLTAFRNHLINNHILAQAVIPGMQSAGFGRIVNIISTSVKLPLPNLGVSNTVRGAVGNWSKTLANELGPYGITVNNVLPGATETDRLKSIIHNKSNKSGAAVEDISQEMLHEIPAGRFGKPEEPAFAVCFLCSEQAAYINGTNVVVDGGRTGNL
jgi:3-oxoacyl-[acyl-carrier protein] reductase